MSLPSLNASPQRSAAISTIQEPERPSRFANLNRLPRIPEYTDHLQNRLPAWRDLGSPPGGAHRGVARVRGELVQTRQGQETHNHTGAQVREILKGNISEGGGLSRSQARAIARLWPHITFEPSAQKPRRRRWNLKYTHQAPGRGYTLLGSFQSTQGRGVIDVWIHSLPGEGALEPGAAMLMIWNGARARFAHELAASSLDDDAWHAWVLLSGAEHW